ncbi:rCG26752 [Rattus norvegicus]|uniref:RCG26752 n=1 Tax=Rattus norvegicus TaxID=10116 RepID=A6HNK7_RAT|nr:rCG26752 [Rattus norvegicus]
MLPYLYYPHPLPSPTPSPALPNFPRNLCKAWRGKHLHKK